MTRQAIEKLLELIDILVNESEPWKEKRQQVLDLATEQDQTNLREFCDWFLGGDSE